MLDILLGVVGTVFGWVGALFPAKDSTDNAKQYIQHLHQLPATLETALSKNPVTA